MSNQTKNQAGFSLVELMIAIVIAMFGVLAVGAMQITSMKGNTQSWLTTQAANIASSKMDELLTLDYPDDTVVDCDDSELLDCDGDGAFTDLNGDGDINQDDVEPGLNDTDAAADHSQNVDNYAIFWNVADDFPRAGVKTIRVIVNWGDHGVAKTLSITNIKAEE